MPLNNWMKCVCVLAAQNLAARKAARRWAEISPRVRPNVVEGLERRVFLSISPAATEAPPALVSISRTTAVETPATGVTFTVTFSEAVTGVTTSDFLLNTGSNITTSPLTISPSAGPASVYTVSVNNIAGTGNLQLVAQDASGIVNAASEPLTGFVNFSPQSPDGPQAQDITVADINGDGKPDIIATDLTSNSIAVLLGNGNGTFQAAQSFSTGANSHPYDIAVGALAGDGRLDIVTTDRGSDCISVLIGNGDGTFQSAQTYSTGTGSAPYSVQLADINGDGKLDLIVTEPGTKSVGVLLGNGNGTFASQQSFAVGNQPVSVVVADVNGDGKPDLIVANDNDTTVGVLLNTTPSGSSNVTFASQQTFAAGGNDSQVLVADLAGDGLEDLVTTNSANGNIAVLLGNGNGTFQSPQTLAAVGVTSLSLADINGDGRMDLVGNYFNGGVTVLLGNGNGTFQDAQTYDINASPVSFVTTADVNGDGLPDLVVAEGGNYDVGVVLTNLSGPEFNGPTYTILKHNAVLNIGGAELFFDGNSHAATLSVLGVNGEDLSSLTTISYKNLANNTFSSTPPIQPGAYEIFASFSGNSDYNAIATYDTGQSIVIDRQSSLQSLPSGRLPAITLIAGQKITPIHLNIRLFNAAASTASGLVTVEAILSSSTSTTPGDPIAGAFARKLNVKAGKTAPFGAIVIRSIPTGLNGTLHVMIKLIDANGAVSFVSAGTIVVAAPVTDLATAAIVAPAHAHRGKKVTATLTINQEGNIAFTGIVPVQLFLSTTGPTPAANAIDLGLINARLSLRPNKKGLLRLSATIPSSVSPGSYFVIASLDPNNTLGDVNPTNNMVASLKQVVVS